MNLHAAVDVTFYRDGEAVETSTSRLYQTNFKGRHAYGDAVSLEQEVVVAAHRHALYRLTQDVEDSELCRWHYSVGQVRLCLEDAPPEAGGSFVWADSEGVSAA